LAKIEATSATSGLMPAIARSTKLAVLMRKMLNLPPIVIR
jgi:hypothetical protein